MVDFSLILNCWPNVIQYYAWWATILPLFLLCLYPSPWHHTVYPMLCPSPLQYTVDPILLPSRNLGKNAMERFRGLLPDIILLTQRYPILCLMGYYIASVSAFPVSFSLTSYCWPKCCVLLPGSILLTHCYCHRGTRLKMPWRGFVVVGFVLVAFYPNYNVVGLYLQHTS